MTKGYMIFVERGAAPSKIHPDITAAFSEARRLAKKHPEQVVTVLEIKQQMIGRVQVLEI